MKRQHPRLRLLLTLSCALLAGACASTPKPEARACDLYLEAASNVNPDGQGRPAPILVGLYTLKSTAAFEASDFPSLQDRAKAVLADDLVSFEQIILLPGERKLIQRSADPSVHALGVVAGYRDLARHTWKATYALPADGAGSVFSFWPSTHERLVVQVKLGGGLIVRTMDWAHR
ncbi:type VI secretion system lipoprotein TssJ [Paraburkholderia sp.]|uniref:type VI secretion system lipoprotein TssJ n=1 Tax=Paraburkholderia sp. TaxID=1926495 RepID=UPI002D3C579C|nr:type VI secretion system lipoprotein TssJ [Paraburkholderia sp.]HZZ06511.1 type VI secretion system lipoprotein TssJ [Paraburkholderia sp.]